LTPELAVSFEASWTNWSRFNSLVIKFDNPLRTPSVTNENWKDSFFTSIGLDYKVSDKWTLRTGFAYDSAPTPDEDRTPRIPDSDRIWSSFGATYKVNEKYSVSAAYTHIWALAADSSLKDSGSGANNLRGNLTGNYDAHVDIVAMQVSAKF
ncbi:outer membrane protein transport protein, partial [bacterium]|nr:outer membrane protein transport protein [bacterium]